MGIVDFPTRISHITATAIENTFIDITCYEDYQVIPFINDLSDHDAQLLTIKIPVHNQANRLKSTRNLNKTSLLNAQQFSFRKRYSTEDAIIKLTHEILNALNSETLVGSIFFDMAKAFDSVDHSLLIKKKKTPLLWNNRECKVIVRGLKKNEW